MKKIPAVILTLAIACLCLVGCGGGDFEGKWELEELTMSGMTLTDNFFGMPVAVMMQLEVKADGKGVQYANSSGNTKETECTWKADGKTMKWTRESTVIEFKLKDGKLVAEYSEDGQTASVTLKKVSKFTEFTKEDAKDAVGGLFGGSDE